MEAPFPKAARVAALAALALLALAASQGEASFHTEVPAGAWRALDLQALPEGTLVHASVQASADLEVAFVRKRELAGYPRNGTPLFRGTAQKKLDFTVTIPDEGDWEIVLDNRKGVSPVVVDIAVQAVRSSQPPATPNGPSPDRGI